MILIVDLNYKENSLGLEEFVLPIKRLIKDKTDILHYTKVNSKIIEKYDKIILSGTTLKQPPLKKSAFEWILSANKPILGICAGMQVIGLVFDCKLIKCPEIGMSDIITVNKNIILSGDFQGYTIHNFAVLPNNEFITLAKSKTCVEAIKHKNKDIYGVLFHPEVRNNDIISNFISI